MNRFNIVSALAVIWLVLFAGSFIAFQMTEPSGDGFTRGLNRLSTFFAWQTGALADAVAAFVVSRGLDPTQHRRIRRLGAAPLVASGVLVLGFVALYAILIFMGGT